MPHIYGSISDNGLNVDTNDNIFIRTPGHSPTGSIVGGGNSNSSAILSENDSGEYSGSRYVLSPECDADNKIRTSKSYQLDDEVFNYLAQNTGKYQYYNTTMTMTWNASGLLLNTNNINTNTTGASLRSYAFFPKMGSGETLYGQFSCNFSVQPTTNCVTDFGLFLQPTTNPYAPTDGVYFRVKSTGVYGVINNNGTETETLLPFTYKNNTNYEFIISSSKNKTCFWINNMLYAKVLTPNDQSAPFVSGALPFGIRQAISGGTASAGLQVRLKNYSVSIGGHFFINTLSGVGNAVYGSYQGLSGGTMGSLSVYANSTNATAAVPANTSLTANLPAGLGGQAWETFSLAVTTDGILMSYQVPAGTVAILGKRLKITGVKLSSFIQTVISGGPTVRTFTLNYGHTAVSLATGEAATTKARRVVLLPELTQSVLVTQAVSTFLNQPGGSVSMFPEPIYVNPGEFVSVSVKQIGTAVTLGTITSSIQLIYSWE